MHSKVNFFVIIFCVAFNSSIFAEEEKDCMTEQGADSYLDKFSDPKINTGVFASMSLEGNLEKCIVKGSVYAEYTLGVVNYVQAVGATAKAKRLKNEEPEVFRFASKIASDTSNEALNLLRSAELKGNVRAMFKLGEIYREGIIVTPSKIIAGKYFVNAGFAAYKVGLKNAGARAYESALEVSPEHPDLSKLKNLVYE